MDYQQRIEIVPGKRSGKPCIKGTRICVHDVLSWLATDLSHDNILHDYPELSQQDIYACLSFAAHRDRSMHSPDFAMMR